MDGGRGTIRQGNEGGHDGLDARRQGRDRRVVQPLRARARRRRALMHLFEGLCKNLYWAKTCCTAILPSTCYPQGLLNAARVCLADRREAHALQLVCNNLLPNTGYAKTCKGQQHVAHNWRRHLRVDALRDSGIRVGSSRVICVGLVRYLCNMSLPNTGYAKTCKGQQHVAHNWRRHLRVDALRDSGIRVGSSRVICVGLVRYLCNMSLPNTGYAKTLSGPCAVRICWTTRTGPGEA